MRRTLRLCCTATLTLQVACGGSGGAVEAARFHYAKGNLEQAEAKLAGVVSADAAALSIRIRARRADRDALARRIAQLSAMDPRLALEGLEDLLFDSEDPIAREWVELAQSEAYDRRAEGGRVHRTIHPTGYRPDELVENEIAGEPPLVARHDRFDDPERRGAAPRTAAQSAAPRPERVAGAPPIRGEPMADPGPADPEGAPAREAARSIDLLVAAERWMEQGLASPAGEEREACIARARGLERRHRLREEIVSARSSDPVRFADCCDIAAAGPSGLIVGEEFTTWEALPTETLETAARLVELSAEAECGLLDELLLHAHGARRTELLAELPRWITRGVLSEEGAWEIVARERGETLPEGGYVFDDGGWVERGEHEAALLAARIEALETALVKADEHEREEAFAALDDLGDVALAALARSLEVRWERAVREVERGKTLRNLIRLSERRRALDRAREAALALIFDTEEYFYPYRPPEAPWEKAKLYPEVQSRVDELVAGVRAAWEIGRPVSLSGSFREGVEELAWMLERSEEIDVERPWPAELPDWLFAVETRLGQLTLRDFAWDETEREALARNRVVIALNERNWAVDSRPKEQSPAAGERVQVEITNDYRLMFGRRALAWNPQIQAAAVMHSEYMANTGDFGHFEPDPERRAPGDRMRLCGYTFGVSENCHAGSGDPGGAHAGWIRSSGHHRNLLGSGHREMASAQRGRYWTQNFGVGRAFENELDLDSWQD